MKINNWLIINNRGSTRITKNKPGIAFNEVCMQLSIDIPNSVFERPQLKANIKVEGEMNYEFDYQMNADIKEVLQTLPNVHLLKIDVIKEEPPKELK